MARRKCDEIRAALDEEAALEEDLLGMELDGRRYPGDVDRFSGEYQDRIGAGEVLRTWTSG